MLGKLISPQSPVPVFCGPLFTNVLQYDRMDKEALHDLTLSELNMTAPTDKIIESLLHQFACGEKEGGSGRRVERCKCRKEAVPAV